MHTTVRVTLQGLPERVHEIADALDQAAPGTFEWYDTAAITDQFEILLQGVGIWDGTATSSEPDRAAS